MLPDFKLNMGNMTKAIFVSQFLANNNFNGSIVAHVNFSVMSAVLMIYYQQPPYGKWSPLEQLDLVSVSCFTSKYHNINSFTLPVILVCQLVLYNFRFHLFYWGVGSVRICLRCYKSLLIQQDCEWLSEHAEVWLQERSQLPRKVPFISTLDKLTTPQRNTQCSTHLPTTWH